MGQGVGGWAGRAAGGWAGHAKKARAMGSRAEAGTLLDKSSCGY